MMPTADGGLAMKESDVRKERTCRHCDIMVYTDAMMLKRHVAVCKRAKAIGIVLADATIVMPPRVEIIQP
jgi:hypothetical protein